MRDSTAFQIAAHRAALELARGIVTRLEQEGPAKGWATDNLSLAVTLAEIEGDSEHVSRELNTLLYG